MRCGGESAQAGAFVVRVGCRKGRDVSLCYLIQSTIDDSAGVRKAGKRGDATGELLISGLPPCEGIEGIPSARTIYHDCSEM